ncbi:MAG: LVIVD repeat-containing protein, partial [Thermoplasmatota archaeon]
MRRLLAMALVLLFAAGCMQGADRQGAFEEAQRAVDDAARHVLALDHDEADGHRDAALHQGSFNMQLVGYSNGIDGSGDPNRIPRRGAFNEIALRDHYAYLSRTSDDGSFGGFSVVDVADPAHPQVVGDFRAQGGSDVEVSDDGALAFLSTQRNTPDQTLGALKQTQDPATGLGRGVYIVSLADPAHPALDNFVPLPYNGPHTLTYYHHPDGDEYLFVCTYDLVTDPGTGAITAAAPATQRLLVYLLQRNPAPGAVPGLPGAALLPVAQYQKVPPASARLVFPHDTSVTTNAAGQVVVDVAYWDLGVRLLDFTHPPGPSADIALAPPLPEIGSFTDFAPSAFNNIHFAKSFAEPMLLNGTVRQVTVAEPEIITADHETGQLTFLDTTDATQPTKVSWWTLPAQEPPLGVTDLDFSPHNFDTWDGKVAVAHYHAGVWVVDLSTPEDLVHPREVGFYMTAKARADSPALQPDAWSVKQKDGLLYASDEASGLYI